MHHNYAELFSFIYLFFGGMCGMSDDHMLGFVFTTQYSIVSRHNEVTSLLLYEAWNSAMILNT